MSKKLLCVGICLLATQAIAYEPPTAFLQQFAGMPATGSLFLRYCLVSRYICVERHAEAWGQVCDPYLAHLMGVSHEAFYRGEIEGDVDGVALPGFRYAGWRCALDSPADAKKYKITTEGGP